MVERQVHIHWSRVVLAGLLTFTLCQLLVTKVIASVVRLHVSRTRYVASRSHRQQTRARAPRTAARGPTTDAAPDVTTDVVLT